MERLRRVNGYGKIILAAMAVMLLAFGAVYGWAAREVGYVYQGAFLTCSREGAEEVYSGDFYGTPAAFTVTQEKEVFFSYGEETYGPYTAKEDPAAIPAIFDGSHSRKYMTGVEVWQGEEQMFRGAVRPAGKSVLLYNEWGSVRDVRQKPIETAYGNFLPGEVKPEPTVYTILELMGSLGLERSGDWKGYWIGLPLCWLNAATILFAEELFQIKMALLVRDAYLAEPSDWELLSRHLGWGGMALAALVIFVEGLI